MIFSRILGGEMPKRIVLEVITGHTFLLYGQRFLAAQRAAWRRLGTG